MTLRNDNPYQITLREVQELSFCYRVTLYEQGQSAANKAVLEKAENMGVSHLFRLNLNNKGIPQ
jgi:hypothetical protein